MDTADQNVSRRSFISGAACTLASLSVSLAFGPAKAFAGQDGSAGLAGLDEASDTAETIAIIHTNDVHCSVYNNTTALGYAALVDYVSEQRTVHAEGNVALVDAGDILQGALIGANSNGEMPARLITACGYDAVAPGNHEIDYGIDRLRALAESLNMPFVCCNFLDADGNTLFDPYLVKEYRVRGQVVRIAYVGVLTPATTADGEQALIMDEDGNIIYSCCEDETGEKLYAAVQNAVDDARTTGDADYVVLLSHLGQGYVTKRWASDALVANTTGIDIVVDGHSHNKYVRTDKNAAGQDVVVAQTGWRFQSFGHIEIDPVSGTATASLDVTAKLIESWDGSDAQIEALIAQVREGMEPAPDEVVGSTEAMLCAVPEGDAAASSRLQETNFGDLMADAFAGCYKASTGKSCDLALFCAAGFVQNVPAGQILFRRLSGALPYCNALCVLDVSGQLILDMLEVGYAALPTASSWFFHVSRGVTCTVRTDIPTPVVFSDGGSVFVGIEGERRVRDAAIDGVAIDPARLYTLVSTTYVMAQGKKIPHAENEEEAERFGYDVSALYGYIVDDLGGTVGAGYLDPNGDGRIKIVDHDDSGSDNDPDDDPKKVPDGSGEGAGASDDTKPAKKTSDGGLPATGDAGVAGVATAAVLGAGAFAAAAALEG